MKSLIDSARVTFRVSSGRASPPGPSTGSADQDGLGLARAILDSATNAAVVYDAEHDTFLANARAHELHGMPPASVAFDEWGAYHDVTWANGAPVDPADLPLAHARAGECMPATRLVFRPRLGEARVVEVTAEPLLDAHRRTIGAISIFRDVDAPEIDTEALRLRCAVAAEDALRLAEERFRKIFEEGPLGIVMFGDDLTITDANGACCRITGYRHDELIGRNIADVTYPEDAALDFDQVQRVLSGEIPSYRTEKRCLTGDGGTVWVSFTATMVRDDAGNPLYGLGIVEDIDERKRIESLMIKQNERLASGLESSLAELQLSRARILASADLERRRIERDLHDGAQQRLVALRVRLGLAQDLLREDPVRGADLLKELGDDVDAALEEVRMLARGVYPSVLADRGIVEALRAAARNSPLPVTLKAAVLDRFSEELETAVYFTCVEALQNAAKHARGETSVLISLSQGDSLRFEVRDNGVGFSPSGASAGAGLANMRDRIESVGGKLTVASAPGEGTHVSGSIPLR